jgi:NADH-quinone oxidoreductase subunit G
MPTFKLDDKTIPFEPGDTIIQAAHKQGIEIPHYCWHPGLSVAANCRMCLVEILPAKDQRPISLDVLEWDPVAKDYKAVKKPKLQPACQYAAAENMEVLSDLSDHVKKARAAVQEFLLLNHPVDCPICDQAGECKLQDYWLEFQKTQKRMRDEPVHKPKAVSFGPTIVYDAERCVMCTRCIRFFDEVAKDPVLDMRERGNLNEIFVAPGRQLDNKYTYMADWVCPVGALTTKDFRFKARVWFLRSVKSVCQGCATGCNAYLDYDSRFNRTYRYRPRENEAVNKYWMCDDGMVSYKAAHEDRVLEPRVAGKTSSLGVALEAAKKQLDGVPRDSIAIVYSAQHSLEDNWALRELARTLIETEQLFWSGAPDGYEDEILIHKDKSSNTAGVKQLAELARPFSALVEGLTSGAIKHVIALGGATPTTKQESEAAEKALASAETIITIASHDGPLTKAAAIVLPASSWAEASGTYVNFKGLRQQSDKAIESQGSSKPAWQQIALLARALGYEASWTKLRDIRSRLGEGSAPVHTTITDPHSTEAP